MCCEVVASDLSYQTKRDQMLSAVRSIIGLMRAIPRRVFSSPGSAPLLGNVLGSLAARNIRRRGTVSLWQLLDNVSASVRDPAPLGHTDYILDLRLGQSDVCRHGDLCSDPTVALPARLGPSGRKLNTLYC